jgi:hypothetical protein
MTRDEWNWSLPMVNLLRSVVQDSWFLRGRFSDTSDELTECFLNVFHF